MVVEPISGLYRGFFLGEGKSQCASPFVYIPDHLTGYGGNVHQLKSAEIVPCTCVKLNCMYYVASNTAGIVVVMCINVQ